MSAFNDPFYDLQQEVQAQLANLRSLVSSYERLSATAGLSSPELAQTEQDLITTLEDLDLNLRDLKESVDAILQSPDQFFELTQAEIDARKKFVEGYITEVEKIRANYANMSMAMRRKRPPTKDGFTTIDVGGDAAEPDLEWEREQQQLLMREQDQQLEGVLGTVNNLRQQAQVMGQELGDQIELLEDLDNRVTTTQDKLQLGMRRVKWILRKNEETASSCCIILLIVVLIILLILIITM
ncbi:syntaxin 6, N-terminal-domain-containing protein [Dipodascopsis tothii]|uniref:syntaxin 6, N-terminal-domain-containing protein n=1 Tax=Dipodascopsis tothii TaxID=44089 RepID=UPI0034D005F6